MMSESRLYEVARQRIQRRNRRLTVWFVHLAAYLAYIGYFATLAPDHLGDPLTFVLLAWTGLFVLDTVVMGLSIARADDIENTVARLRTAAGERRTPGHAEALPAVASQASTSASASMPHDRLPVPDGAMADAALLEPLTPREREVLALLVTGASNQAIAEQLVIAPNTAKRHVRHILAKLQVANRTQAARRAVELDLI